MKEIIEATQELRYITEMTKNTDGTYYCIICKSQGKDLEKIKTAVRLVIHWMRDHYYFYAGLRLGIKSTVEQISTELKQFWNKLSKQKEFIDTHAYIV